MCMFIRPKHTVETVLHSWLMILLSVKDVACILANRIMLLLCILFKQQLERTFLFVEILNRGRQAEDNQKCFEVPSGTEP